MSKYTRLIPSALNAGVSSQEHNRTNAHSWGVRVEQLHGLVIGLQTAGPTQSHIFQAPCHYKSWEYAQKIKEKRNHILNYLMTRKIYKSRGLKENINYAENPLMLETKSWHQPKLRASSKASPPTLVRISGFSNQQAPGQDVCHSSSAHSQVLPLLSISDSDDARTNCQTQEDDHWCI